MFILAILKNWLSWLWWEYLVHLPFCDPVWAQWITLICLICRYHHALVVPTMAGITYDFFSQNDEGIVVYPISSSDYNISLLLWDTDFWHIPQLSLALDHSSCSFPPSNSFPARYSTFWVLIIFSISLEGLQKLFKISPNQLENCMEIVCEASVSLLFF